MNNGKKKTLFIAACLSPALILLTLFVLVPTFEVFRMSLYSWGGFSNNQQFIGLDNFKVLWNDTKFMQAFQNTVLLIVVVTIVTVLLALFFAAILTREKLKGTDLFRIIFYIPNILSIVVIAGVFSAIYNPTQGLLNSVLGMIKLENLQRLWLGDQNIVIYSIVGALIWQATGYYMVMYMSSMASIPESFYEAASLEGAGRVTQFFNITLPLIWNNIRTTLTFFIISTINLSFLLVQAMTGGGPDGSTNVFLFYMYNQAYTNSTYGYGMSIGVIVFLFSFALSAIINRVTKREILQY
ncbi:sn-glycerol-3-phosphate transport system permease protein UgpA [Jeotgalibaca dankookensis]|uniref:sn-glycerol-3-phosphate transport system permease protein UgpA n=1 Tax=Jeotgalibaca dankookensis TaxID=708126 RepID=A0A1S6IQ84_9LACT|nr:sugar ABC transporter permease [Jeotgalibaca dankookensis]AQS53716.1 sn-glycerol-3-phosphate transport system permease protein UgpA [Jeotgalibaca dankookensis]